MPWVRFILSMSCLVTAVITWQQDVNIKYYSLFDDRLLSYCTDLLPEMTLNPLANPKGIKLLCELCQKPAFIQCTKCRVTYYWYASIIAHVVRYNMLFIGLTTNICY